jgi:hypothetical protein
MEKPSKEPHYLDKEEGMKNLSESSYENIDSSYSVMNEKD